MSALTFNAFLSEALCMPIELRSRLASVLIDSLDADEDASLSPGWRTEVNRRASELEDCNIQPMTFDEFRGQIEERVA